VEVEEGDLARKGIVGDWRSHFTQETSGQWDRWGRGNHVSWMLKLQWCRWIEEELERTGVRGMRGWC